MSDFLDIWIPVPKTTMTYHEKLLKMKTHYDQSTPILPGVMMKLCKSTWQLRRKTELSEKCQILQHQSKKRYSSDLSFKCQFQIHPMRISKASPSTEVYNITIEGSETSFDNHSIESGQSSQIIAPDQGLSFNQELKTKNGSDSSSEVPDDVKGKIA